MSWIAQHLIRLTSAKVAWQSGTWHVHVECLPAGEDDSCIANLLEMGRPSIQQAVHTGLHSMDGNRQGVRQEGLLPMEYTSNLT